MRTNRHQYRSWTHFNLAPSRQSYNTEIHNRNSADSCLTDFKRGVHAPYRPQGCWKQKSFRTGSRNSRKACNHSLKMQQIHPAFLWPECRKASRYIPLHLFSLSAVSSQQKNTIVSPSAVLIAEIHPGRIHPEKPATILHSITRMQKDIRKQKWLLFPLTAMSSQHCLPSALSYQSVEDSLLRSLLG